jgi:hypothetical protein
MTLISFKNRETRFWLCNRRTRLPFANNSGKLPETHSVRSFCDHNLGVFIVTKVALKNTEAVPPAHPVPRMPNAAYPELRRCRAPRVPLTFLARLTTGQSLCTGHVDASLENRVVLWPSPIRPLDPPSGR